MKKKPFKVPFTSSYLPSFPLFLLSKLFNQSITYFFTVLPYFQLYSTSSQIYVWKFCEPLYLQPKRSLKYLLTNLVLSDYDLYTHLDFPPIHPNGSTVGPPSPESHPNLLLSKEFSLLWSQSNHNFYHLSDNQILPCCCCLVLYDSISLFN